MTDSSSLVLFFSLLFGWEGRKNRYTSWMMTPVVTFFVYHLNLVRTQKWRIPCFSRWSLFATENRWWSLMEVEEVDVTQFSGETRSIFGTWSYCERNSSYTHHSIWAWTLWAQTIFSTVDPWLQGEKNTIIFKCLCWSYRPPSPQLEETKVLPSSPGGLFPRICFQKKKKTSGWQAAK